MSILAPNPHILYRETHQRDQQHTCWNGASSVVVLKSYWIGFDRRKYDWNKIEKRNHFRVDAFWQDSSRPTSVELEPILDCDQLDQILLTSQQLSQPIIIDWMASWCRKCIYLKPKLEKLAAEYDTKIKFYCVDVNKVPQTLVKRGNVSKMPTIQLWKDGEMKAEVIGGHKAWLVLDEVEAYRPNDSACHGRFGITARTAPVFGPGGHAYVYLCYGLHTMLNVVADKEGVGAAVLICSCAPVSGLDTIQQRRSMTSEKPVLLAGPGEVGQALGISTEWSSHPLFIPGGLEILDGPKPEKILIGPRVGIEYASPEHISALWRFAIADTPWISAPRNTLRPPHEYPFVDSNSGVEAEQGKITKEGKIQKKRKT